MKKTAKPNIEETMLSHELEFITGSPDQAFNEYLTVTGEESEILIKQFDNAVIRLSNRYSSSNMTEVTELMAKKRSILHELLETASTLGLTIDVSVDDIPNLVEAELDTYIMLFSAAPDSDLDNDY